MTDYKAMYKCRLCGETFQFAHTGNRNVALEEVVELSLSEHSYKYKVQSETSIHRYLVHNCADGSIGYADFLGFKEGTDDRD